MIANRDRRLGLLVHAHLPGCAWRNGAIRSASPRTSLGTGIAKPVGARLDWASLLRRVYLEDVLACPCGGRRPILSDVTEKAAIVAILHHLGLPAEPPPSARARSPSFEAA